MKYFFLLFCLLPCGVVAQEPPGILQQIILDKQDTARVYYVDSIVPLSMVRFRKKMKGLPWYGSGGNSIKLTKKERDKIRYESVILHWPVWGKDLFNNSHRVSSDSARFYMSLLSAKNFPYHPKNGYHLWRFSQPVYLRNGTICLVGFNYMCHSLCGETEIAFYKKNGEGKWERFVVVYAGVF